MSAILHTSAVMFTDVTYNSALANSSNAALHLLEVRRVG